MKEIEFLKTVVRSANEISKNKFTVKEKDTEGDLVTNLDIEIEKHLINQIKKNYPDFDIVSEELNTNNQITNNCFTIDPIDGTVNFANNSPFWGIQIACIKSGKTIASVISLPRINELYWADETGAYLNDKRISVNEVPIKTALYAIDGTNTISAINNMNKYSRYKRNFGALCISLAFVATGRIHGAVFTNENPWDYVPGIFICEKAGASICNKKGFHAAAMNKEFLNILELETAKKVSKANIFVIHSLNGDTLKMWGNNVKEIFANKGIDVYLPEFPIKANSTYENFKKIFKPYITNGKLNKDSIVIAHSIGNPYFIRFAREMNFVPKTYIAVAPEAVYEYSSNRNDYIVEVKKQAYLKEKDFEYVRNNIKNIICLYSDEDDNNAEKFTRFISDTNAKGKYLKYYNHFDGYHRIYQIPELIELLNKEL